MTCSTLIVASCILVACTVRDSTSFAIAKQFAESKGNAVSLTAAVPSTWEKVCVLRPYSSNDTAKKTLGFEWNAEAKTSIQTNEGISLLLFVQDKQIVSYVEHPRNHGDFSNLTTQCFPREKTQFIHDQKPTKGWPGLFLKNEVSSDAQSHFFQSLDSPKLCFGDPVGVLGFYKFHDSFTFSYPHQFTGSLFNHPQKVAGYSYNVNCKSGSLHSIWLIHRNKSVLLLR